jgi:hypothetical protein
LGDGGHHATTGSIFQEKFTKKLRERYSQMNSMKFSRRVGKIGGLFAAMNKSFAA